MRNEQPDHLEQAVSDPGWSYEAPAFARHDLRVVTLGGSVGSGDSGAPTTQFPAGNSFREEPDDSEAREDNWIG